MKYNNIAKSRIVKTQHSKKELHLYLKSILSSLTNNFFEFKILQHRELEN